MSAETFSVPDWGVGSPPPPVQSWWEILTEPQLRLLIAINDRDAAYLAVKRRQITCDRLRKYGLVKLVEGRLLLTDWGRAALTEFAEECEYMIDDEGFVIHLPYQEDEPTRLASTDSPAQQTDEGIVA